MIAEKLVSTKIYYLHLFMFQAICGPLIAMMNIQANALANY